MKITIGTANSKNSFPFNIAAVLIKFMQNTDYSHYWLSYSSITGTTKYLDSTFWTTRDRMFYEFNKEYTKEDIWEVELDCNEVDFYKWVETVEGRGYGFLHILGLAYRIVARFFGFIIKNPIRDGQARLICNETCIRFLNEFLSIKAQKDPDDMDLNDTYVHLSLLAATGFIRRVK